MVTEDAFPALSDACSCADRMGFRYPTITERVDVLLGRRPDIHSLLMDQLSLLMDQLVPVDPFRTADTGAEAP